MVKTIKLSGRIDTKNATEVLNYVENEISSLPDEIIIDFEDLQYICSAGLRMILKLKMRNSETSIINCNDHVYETLEMTGFTNIMDISKINREIKR